MDELVHRVAALIFPRPHEGKRFHHVKSFFSSAKEPSLSSVKGLPRALSPTIERAANQYLDTLANNIGALETPYESEPRLIPKGTRGARFRFSQDTTTELETACHRLGIHLEAAVHAAVTATAYCRLGFKAQTS